MEDLEKILTCPISLEIMEDPVIIEGGHTFEKKEIKKHFRTKNTNPLTNNTLNSTKIINNIALKHIIDLVRKK